MLPDPVREYARVRDMVVFFGSQFARDGGGKRGGFLEAMKVDQLKVELAERGSTRSGRKAILQRRLHTLLVQAAIERHRESMDI